MDENGEERWDEEEVTDEGKGGNGDEEENGEGGGSAGKAKDEKATEGGEDAKFVDQWVFENAGCGGVDNNWDGMFSAPEGEIDSLARNFVAGIAGVAEGEFYVQANAGHRIAAGQSALKSKTNKKLPLALCDDGCSAHLFGSGPAAQGTESSYSEKGIPTRRVGCAIPCHTASGKSACRSCLAFPIVFGWAIIVTVMVVSAYDRAPLLFGERLRRSLETTRVNSKTKSAVSSKLEGRRAKCESSTAGLYLGILNPVLDSSKLAAPFSKRELEKLKGAKTMSGIRNLLNSNTNYGHLDQVWNSSMIAQGYVPPKWAGLFVCRNMETNRVVQSWAEGGKMRAFRSPTEEETFAARNERASKPGARRMGVDWASGEILNDGQNKSMMQNQGRVADSIIVDVKGSPPATNRARVQQLWRNENANLGDDGEMLVAAIEARNMKVGMQEAPTFEVENLSGYGVALRQQIKDNWGHGGKAYVWRGESPSCPLRGIRGEGPFLASVRDGRAGEVLGGAWNTKNTGKEVAGILQNRCLENDVTGVVFPTEDKAEEEEEYQLPTLAGNCTSKETWEDWIHKVRSKISRKNVKQLRGRQWVGAIPLLKRSTAMPDGEGASRLYEGIAHEFTYEEHSQCPVAMRLGESLMASEPQDPSSSSSIPRGESKPEAQTGEPGELVSEAEQRKLDADARRLVNQLASGLGYPPLPCLESQIFDTLGTRSQDAKNRPMAIIKRVCGARLFGLPYQRLPGSKTGSIYQQSPKYVLLIDTVYVTDHEKRSRAVLVGIIAGTR